jgi:hypothetical protein
MTKTEKFFLFCAFSVTTFCSLAISSEVMIPATQIEQGHGSVGLYYNHTEQTLNLSVHNRDAITVAGTSYFSTVTNDLETKGISSSVIAKMIINPWSGFYYWVKAGAGIYELEIPSVTVKNQISSQNNGLVLGTGIRTIILPDTIVTPSLSVDVGVNYSNYNLDTFHSNGESPQRILNILELTDIQATVLVSKKYLHAEPYAGLKVNRIYTVLKGEVTSAEVRGIKDNAGIVAGARFRIYNHEALVLEASFIGETSYSAGWNVEF